MTKLLRPDLVTKLVQFAESPFRPPEIIELQAWIDGEFRALQLRESVLGTIDEEALVRAAVVVEAKLQLDWLYTEWAEQELSLESLQPTQHRSL